MKNNTGPGPNESQRVTESMTRLKISLAVVVLAGIVTAWVLEHQAQKLREQNRAWQQKVNRLSQPDAENQPVALAADRNSTLSAEQQRELLRLRGKAGVRRQEKDELGKLQAENRRLGTNLFHQLIEGKTHVNLEQLAPYLEAKQRNAESLLAAFRATGDSTVLREAVEKYPDDPRVNFAAAYKSDSPEERRQRLEALKQSAPDNALANYLSAQDYFKAGQPDRAVQELVAAAGKPKFQDYSGDFMESAEEAYRYVGLSTLEAQTMAMASLPLPALNDLKRLGQSLADLANLYGQAGDEASAQSALQMGMALGRRVGEPSGQSSTMHDQFGIDIERAVLSALNPASTYDSAGHTVKDRLDELARQREALKSLIGDGSYFVLQELPAPDQLGFFERMKVSGEVEALRWARNKLAKP